MAHPYLLSVYARQLAEQTDRTLPGDVVGLYLHGSAALGGWNPARSDVDVLVVVDDRALDVTDRLLRLLVESARTAPGTGLECSVVTLAEAKRPRSPWPFLLHVAGGHSDIRIVHGRDTPGDKDLLIHYLICRHRGWAVSGAPPADVFGEVGEDAVRVYLARELRWGIAHAGLAYNLLNACRCAFYAENQVILSKLEAGRAALGRGLGPQREIARALAVQEGFADDEPLPEAAAEWVRAVADLVHHNG
jgi:streptomycin 3"-adenylyltransferase